MAPIPFFIVEAFNVGRTLVYTGNPAAVCILEYDDDISDDEKQKIASTLNMTETAFVSNGWRRWPLAEKSAVSPSSNFENLNPQNVSILHRIIRWFTPFNEAPLCGHATLASTVATFAIAKEMIDGIEKIEFDSKFRGPLAASVHNNTCTGNEWLVTLNFPMNVTEPVPLSSSWLSNLTSVLLGPEFSSNFDKIAKPTIIEDVVYCRQELVLVLKMQKVEGEEPLSTIRRVNPNFDRLGDTQITGDLDVHCFIVTIEGDAKSACFPFTDEDGCRRPQFYSRFFECPQYGLNEDPVTGMAHTILVPYWTKIFESRGGGSCVQVVGELMAHQASSRGGDVFGKLEGDRVLLTGRARIVSKGELYPENLFLKE